MEREICPSSADRLSLKSVSKISPFEIFLFPSFYEWIKEDVLQN